MLDGDKFYKDTKLLDKDEHSIKLGSYEQTLKYGGLMDMIKSENANIIERVRWHPVVLTTTSSKAQAINNQRQKLEGSEVKLISESLVNGSTHVLAGKRNLPKVLQGIIAAKYIVTDAYVDAIAQATRTSGFGDDGETPLPSLLEQDFDANWPDAMKFVPPPSNEPVPREGKYLKPDADRLSLLEGFTFVFTDDQQQATLEPALSLASAKCPYIPVEPGKTSASEIANKIRELAGKASNGSFNDDSPKGVVIVRAAARKDWDAATSQWLTTFTEGLQRELDQRSMEQREFLDAILTKDTSGFKRRLEYEDETTSMPPPSFPRPTPQQAPQNQAASEPPRSRQDFSSVQPSQQARTTPEASQHRETSPKSQHPREPSPEPSPARPTRLRTRRLGTKSKFTGFDDFDDTTSFPAQPAPDPMDEDGPPSNQAAAGTQDMGSSRSRGTQRGAQSQGMFVAEDEGPADATRGRKRASPPADSDDEALNSEEAMDALLPGARALKKRRLERPSPERTPGRPTPPPGSDEEREEQRRSGGKGKGKKNTQQADLKQRAKEHAAAVDKVKHEDEDEPGDVDEVNKLRDLVIVEEMDVPRLTERSSPTNSRPGSRRGAKGKGKGKGKATRSTRPSNEGPTNTSPDPYAGRQNFKRFRRKGEGNNRDYNRGTRVIVGLEPVESKDYGIGEKYWTSFSPSSSKSKKKTQSQSQRSRPGTSSARDRVEDTVPDDDGGEGSGEDLPPVDEMTRQAIEDDEREQQRQHELLPDELAGPTDASWVSEDLQRTQQSLSHQRSSKQSSAARSKQATASARSKEPSASERIPSGSGSGSARKRPGGSVEERTPKRRQTTWRAPVEEEEEESEGDEFAFKLRRRR